jgi:hypothetical protein
LKYRADKRRLPSAIIWAVFLHFLATVLGIFFVLLVLLDAFETVVLPRTVKRNGRLSNLFWDLAGEMFSHIGNIPHVRRRQALLVGWAPVILLILIIFWAVFMILGWSLIHFGIGTRMGATVPSGFTTDLYFSGATFFTLGYGDVVPMGGIGRTLAVIEAGMGFAFLAIVVSYVPVLYNAFSKREVQILLLDSRAGSEPMGSELLHRHATDSCLAALIPTLANYERFGAELLESYLSYPLLAYYRSQHDNQSWLKCLTSVMDACALIEAGFRDDHPWDHDLRFQARATFAMARHVVVDLAYILECPPLEHGKSRLTPEVLAQIRAELASDGYPLREGLDADARLTELRAMYEPYVKGLAKRLYLDLPKWFRLEPAVDNWQTSAWEGAKHF